MYKILSLPEYNTTHVIVNALDLKEKEPCTLRFKKQGLIAQSWFGSYPNNIKSQGDIIIINEASNGSMFMPSIKEIKQVKSDNAEYFI